MDNKGRSQLDRREECLRPLLGERFSFSCHKGIQCFTKCCADLQLILTPYDILRIKRRLRLSAGAFIREYTFPDTEGKSIFPMLRLKMRDDEMRRCPFVSDEGCTIYEDRPGACRHYPLGRAASLGSGRSGDQEFYFLVNESHCLGFAQEREWTVKEWLKDQGADIYNEMNRDWMEIVTSQNLRRGELTEDKLQMFYMTSYNLDRFHDFVFQTRFLKVFDISTEDIQRIRADETRLLKFGMRWLKFALFGESTLRLSPLRHPR